MGIIYIFIFGFGAIIGSFLNVVIDRFNTGRGLGGRSKCDATGKVLSWYELVPVLSYVFQGGKSLHSKTKISIQYPLVEAGTGLLFVLIFQKIWPIFYRFPANFMLGLLFYFFIFSLLVIIFTYDIKHKIIPNFFVWTLNALLLVAVLVFSPTLLHILAGPLVALPLFFLWFVSKGRWLGFGDVKLALGMGWLLGVSGGFAALLVSFWIGAVVGIFILLLKKSKNHEIPFAPFLILATALSFLYTIDMYSISRFFAHIL